MGEWNAFPTYNITFAEGVKLTIEYQMICNGKPMSDTDLNDVVTLALRHSMNTGDVQEILETLAKLRERELPALIKECGIIRDKDDEGCHISYA
jgi:hypothetical protein